MVSLKMTKDTNCTGSNCSQTLKETMNSEETGNGNKTKTCSLLPSVTPTLTLSMGNVQFELVPEKCLEHFGSVTFQQDPYGKMLLKLENFSGVLQVSQMSDEIPKTVTQQKIGRSQTKPFISPTPIVAQNRSTAIKKTTNAKGGKVVARDSKDENNKENEDIHPAKRLRLEEIKAVNLINDPPACKKVDAITATGKGKKSREPPEDDDRFNLGNQSSESLLLNGDDFDCQSWHDDKQKQVQPSLSQQPSLSPPSQTKFSVTTNTINRDEELDELNNVSIVNQIKSLSRVQKIMEDGETIPSINNRNTEHVDTTFIDQSSESTKLSEASKPNLIVADILGNNGINTTNKKRTSTAKNSKIKLPGYKECHEIAESSPVTIIPSVGCQSPCSRWGHTMNAVGNNRLVLYGGQTIESGERLPKTLGDVYIYDLVKHVWFQPFNCEGLPRQWHTCTYLQDRNLMITFGGETINPKNDKPKTTDQIMVLDTELMLWYPPSVTGIGPGGRSGHTATLVSKTNELVVFGGIAQGNRWLNTVSILDTNRWIWTTPKKVSGLPPKPRSYHSAVAINESTILYFGGNDARESFNCVHVLEIVPTTEFTEVVATLDDSDCERMKKKQSKKKDKSSEESSSSCLIWSHPTVTGDVPPPRTGQTLTLLPDNRTVVVYGGWDPNMEEVDNTLTPNSAYRADEEIIFGSTHLLDTLGKTNRQKVIDQFSTICNSQLYAIFIVITIMYLLLPNLNYQNTCGYNTLLFFCSNSSSFTFH